MVHYKMMSILEVGSGIEQHYIFPQRGGCRAPKALRAKRERAYLIFLLLRKAHRSNKNTLCYIV